MISVEDVDKLNGAGTIKRRRRTRDQVDQLDHQILDVLQEDHPQSVRHVFYRMTDPRLPEPVEKSERGYRHVQHRVVELRRSKQLPYGWITDASRRGYFVDTFNGAADFIRQVKGLYRADLWRGADFYCEVWTESRSLAGTVEDDCRDLAVSLYPAGGFTSLSLAYQSAEFINAMHAGRQIVVFYIGDYDPAGVLIDVAIERELRQHLDPEADLVFTRLGITAEQVEIFGLPRKPRKAGDRRARQVTETVEAEAMPAAIMRRMLRDSIEALLPEQALAAAKASEASEMALLDGLVGLVEGGR